MKSTISKMKNTLEGIKSRLEEAGDQISDIWRTRLKKHPDRATKQKKTHTHTHNDSLKELQDNPKCNNNHIIGIPEGEEKEEGIEKSV